MAGLKVIWRGGVAYAAGSIAGQRVRKSLGTHDPARAEELRAQYEARLWKRHSYGEDAVRTFEEAAVEYLNSGGEARFLNPIIRYFRGRALGTIKPEELKRAARTLLPGRKASTWNRDVLSPAKAVINHAAELGWCPHIRVKGFPVARVLRKAADRAWLDAMMARADADGLPHLAACLLFMWQTGARVGEAARVLPEHVDLGRRIVLLAATKTGEWEPCHITQEMVIRLANLAMTDGEPVFGYASRYGIYRRLKAVCARAGLPWIPPHQAGRHSFATHALADGATIREVMEGGRWKSARMVLETYAHAEHGGRAIAMRFDANLAQARKDTRAKRRKQ